MRLSEHAGRWQHIWQAGFWDVEEAQQVVVPSQPVDVEQHGAAGVGDIGLVWHSADGAA